VGISGRWGASERGGDSLVRAVGFSVCRAVDIATSCPDGSPREAAAEPGVP